jgi:hypothetical protein
MVVVSGRVVVTRDTGRGRGRGVIVVGHAPRGGGALAGGRRGVVQRTEQSDGRQRDHGAEAEGG